jgi:hypothetical protein
MQVARSAYSRCGVAPEQANAPDRRHDECYLPLMGRAAGDWQRSAAYGGTRR